MKLLSSRKLLVYLSKCASRTARELASLTIQLQWTMQLWEVLCYFHCMPKKKNGQDKKQFQSRKKKHKTKKTGFLDIYTCREGLKKCIFFYYSSDLSLAPHAELSNIFPKSVLF